MGVVFEISTMTVARTLIIPLLLQFLNDNSLGILCQMSSDGTWSPWSECKTIVDNNEGKEFWGRERECLGPFGSCRGENTETCDQTCDPTNKGILITSNNKAEIFIPSTKEIYMIESIPGSPRFLHTLADNVICGGLFPGSSV